MLYVNPLESSLSVRMDADTRKTFRAHEAVQEFEHLFMYQLVREMRKTVPENTLFGKSSQGDFFNDMMDDALAGKMAESGQLDFSAQLEQQLNLSKEQETPINGTEPKRAFVRRTR